MEEKKVSSYTREYRQKYYELNKNKYHDLNAKKVHCDVCNKDVAHCNYPRHTRSYKHLRLSGKEVKVDQKRMTKQELAEIITKLQNLI